MGPYLVSTEYNFDLIASRSPSLKDKIKLNANNNRAYGANALAFA